LMLGQPVNPQGAFLLTSPFAFCELEISIVQ